MTWPVNKKFGISCPFGKRGPMWSSGWHQGVDFACPVGTPVYSPIPGRVVGVGNTWGDAFGRHQVIIEIKKDRFMILAHMSSYSVVPGQWVEAGTLLGKSGAEGNVSGPHLHLEVQDHRFWQRGRAIDPKFVLDYTPRTSHSHIEPITTSTPSSTSTSSPKSVRVTVKKSPATSKKIAKKSPSTSSKKIVKKSPSKRPSKPTSKK